MIGSGDEVNLSSVNIENLDKWVLNSLNRLVLLFDPANDKILYRSGALSDSLIKGDGLLSSLISGKSMKLLRSMYQSIRGVHFMYGLEFHLLSGGLAASYGSLKRVFYNKRELILGVFYLNTDSGATSRFYPGFSLDLSRLGYWVGNADRTFFVNHVLEDALGTFSEDICLFEKCVPEDKSMLKLSLERVLAADRDYVEFIEAGCQMQDGSVRTFQLRMVGGTFGREKAVRVVFLQTDSWMFQLEMNMYHRRLEMASGRYAGVFMREPALEPALNGILSDAGQLLDASRGFILQLFPDLNRVSMTHEWSASGVESVRLLSSYHAADVKHLVDLMKTGVPVAVHDKREVEKAFSWNAAPHIAKAFLLAPLFRGRNLFGLVGFGEVRFERFWTYGEIDFVSKLAETIRLLMEREDLVMSLKKEKFRAEESARMKEKFMTLVSHEVRNPLNAIIGLSRMLMEEGVGKNNPAHRQALEFIRRSGRDLSGIMENVLNLSKLELYDQTPDFKQINTLELMYTLKSYLKGRLYEKGTVTGTVRWDTLPQMIMTDREFLQGILINLLDNAVKFTDSGQVELFARMQNGTIVFCVSDTGVGIDPCYFEKIFSDFYQVERVDTRKHGGVGAGLAIVRKMADAIGARVQVESRPGEGSCFSVLLPIRSEEKNETNSNSR
ncbi:MAG: GAF domain-containing sensor histidine kinase [Acidobacteria bacterium]|nr:GAF domain-containing sensor histidine kinase [Acidobacteriota bacterium]